MSGFWSKQANSNIEFFIINDAIFSKLCILGDDVEPCFEGSSITAPNISKTFSLDEDFKTTLFSMIKELQYTLQGGNQTVEDEKKKIASVDSSEPIEEPVTPEEPIEEETTEIPTVTDPTFSGEPEEEIGGDEGQETSGETSESGEGADSGSGEGDSGDGGDAGSADYAKKDDEEEKKEDSTEEDSNEGKEDSAEDDEEAKKKYSLLLEQFEELQSNFNALKEESVKMTDELEKLRAYAKQQDEKEKDALIEEFYMLSDEDKKDVIDHKAEYTLDEIKSKLAVLCYDKKVSYNKAEEAPKADVMTVNINSYTADMPEWLKAVEDTKNSKLQ